MHSGLAKERAAYEARPRDGATGKVKPTQGQGFSFWRSVARADAANEKRKLKALGNFRALDRDGNGTLSLREVAVASSLKHCVGFDLSFSADLFLYAS